MYKVSEPFNIFIVWICSKLQLDHLMLSIIFGSNNKGKAVIVYFENF